MKAIRLPSFAFIETTVIYPKILRVRQHFERPIVKDIPAAVRQTLDTLELGKTIKPGQTVALTAGSRGIANIGLILQSVAKFLKDLGAKPYLVPAMGSHGGGTAEGQRKVIESYGITEDFVGVPIKASMEVISLGNSSDGFPVYLDKHASEADHIGVVGRVKPHTGYHGPVESGLCKMMMIGLGKHTGALEYHRILLDYPYDKVVRSVARHMLSKAAIAFGLGIVENAYDDTALLQGVRPADFEKEEERLLLEAKRLIGKLPFREADLLVVDEIGKNISGSGMDTNVVGRKRAFRLAEAPPGQPEMKKIFVRGLAKKSHGNAAGIGLADFTTKRLVDSMDYQATVINCLTAGYPEGANLPVYFETDKEAVDASLKIMGVREPAKARIMRILNTLSVEEVEVSEPCLEEMQAETKLEILGEARPLAFDGSGNLPTLNGH